MRRGRGDEWGYINSEREKEGRVCRSWFGQYCAGIGPARVRKL
jgi:hypothetical protein